MEKEDTEMKKGSLVLVIFAFVVFFSAGTSQSEITGSLWQNQSASVSNAILGYGDPASLLYLGTPDATFASGAINFDSRVTGYTPALFLNNPIFLNPSAGFNASASLNNTYFYFTGSTYLNAGANNFLVPHDDGLQLHVDGIGLVVDEPGPTAPVDTPFVINALSAGFYNFELSYGECCGAPAVLAFEVNGSPVGSTPEPATILLLGSALVGLVVFRKNLVKR
jgi:hypothetical protein